MTIWESLGIHATKDTSIIKAAYAGKAKECHPEEQPEEFQQLQKAYKAAIKYAKSGQAMTGQEGQIMNAETLSDAEEKMTVNGGEQKFDFAYDEVEGYALTDQFFQEFFKIAWNPWLMNNLDCWELFLSQRRYIRLFEDSGFRRNLVMTMCYNLSGWHRKTIQYFDTFLKAFQEEGEEQPETKFFLWRWKKNRPWNRGFFSVERCITREQKELHDILMAGARKKAPMLNVKSKSVYRSFAANRMAVVPYLQVYLSYAQRRQDYIERLYRGNCHGRIFLKTFIATTFLFLLFMFYVNLTGLKT